MVILTHGSDLTLAPTVAPLVPFGDGTVRGALERLGDLKFGAVQLSAALPGLRPRELAPRARRDLLALLARQGVRLAGLDLFLPRRHYLESQHVDRAMAATLAGIELAADLGKVPLSVALPAKDLPEDAKAALVEAAAGHGVALAVHAEDQLEELIAWVGSVDLPALGAAIDPAALLGRSMDPVAMVQRLGKRLRVARLSDVTSEGQGMRCPIGRGELDVTTYRVMVDLAGGRVGPVVLDLQGVDNPVAAAGIGTKAWSDAGFGVRG